MEAVFCCAFFLRILQGSADPFPELLLFVPDRCPDSKIHFLFKAVIRIGQNGCQNNLFLLLLRIFAVKDRSVRIHDGIAAALPAQDKRICRVCRLDAERFPYVVRTLVVPQDTPGKAVEDLLCMDGCFLPRKLPRVDRQ